MIHWAYTRVCIAIVIRESSGENFHEIPSREQDFAKLLHHYFHNTPQRVSDHVQCRAPMRSHKQRALSVGKVSCRRHAVMATVVHVYTHGRDRINSASRKLDCLNDRTTKARISRHRHPRRHAYILVRSSVSASVSWNADLIPSPVHRVPLCSIMRATPYRPTGIGQHLQLGLHASTRGKL